MKSTTTRVKARDTRVPWLPILLVALITFLASGCSADEQPLVLTFDEKTTEVVADATPATARVASAVE